MNRMKLLLGEWQQDSRGEPAIHELGVKLTRRDYARVRALAELFPARSEAQLVTELLTTALDEIEEAMPYEQGERVVGEDEFGDPLYEDVGLTPRFEALAHRYAEALKGEAGR